MASSGRGWPAARLLLMMMAAAQASAQSEHLDQLGDVYLWGNIHNCTPIVAHIEKTLQSGNLTRSDRIACPLIARAMLCWENEYCYEYGHCCSLSDHVKTPHPDMVCRYESGRKVYMLERCPEQWEDGGVRKMCEERDAGDEPFLVLPITSSDTNWTYKNYYCAVCHGDHQNAAFWTPQLECRAWSRINTLSRGNESFIWNNLVRRHDGRWGIDTTEEDAAGLNKCNLSFQATGLTTTPCIYDGCTGIMPRIEDSLCDAYREIYDQESDNCTTAACRLCGIIPCGIRTQFFDYLPGPPSAGIVFILDMRDSSGSTSVGYVNPCTQQQTRNPFRGGECMDVFCEVPGSRLERGKCILPPTTSVEGSLGSLMAGNSTEPASNGYSRVDFTCPKYYLNSSDYEVADNGTAFVPLHNRSYERDEYELHSGGRLAICVPEGTNQEDAKFGDLIIYVTFVCLILSVLCLVLYISAFLAGIITRNLPSLCVTSLSVCLLVAFMCFLLSGTQEKKTPGCRYLAIVALAGLEASFFWSNVMGFDVFLILRRAATDLKVTRGPRLRRFAMYTLYVAVMTAALVTAAVLLDQPFTLPSQYRPRFGEEHCWLNSRLAIAIFFAAPLTVTMVANAALFAAIAWIIRSMGSASSEAVKQPRENVRLFCRLAVMMGLYWIIGLLAGVLDFWPLYYAFVILLSLQGVFIFVGFTMTRATIARLVSGCGGVPRRANTSDSNSTT